MEKYKESIANNPKVEFIHVSLDRDNDAAEDWATGAGFPWLSVLPKDVERSDLLEFRKTGFVPYYTMIDASGKEVANGASAVFAKVAELASASE